MVPMVNMRVGSARNYGGRNGRETDFITVVGFRQQAEFTANYVDVGSMVEIAGVLQERTFRRDDGTTGRAYEVQADQIRHLRRPAKQEHQELILRILQACEQQPLLAPFHGLIGQILNRALTPEPEHGGTPQTGGAPEPPQGRPQGQPVGAAAAAGATDAGFTTDDPLLN
jgi:single-stranded DNA-binding protein